MERLQTLNLKDLGPREEEAVEPHPADLLASLVRAESAANARRAVGAPLPVGEGDWPPLQPTAPSEPQQQAQPAAPEPVRALTAPPAAPPPPELPSSLQRAVRAMRTALPYVQRLLPMLDGNFATAVSNVLAPPTAPPAPPPVDLEPVQQGLAELRSQQRELRVQILDQNSSLKRVEDQLDLVREATDRNTLEQQELIEDLKSVGNKVNMFAALALILLAASIVLNVYLYLQIRHATQ